MKAVKDRPLYKGQLVDVYRNLHTDNLFSVRDVRTRLVAAKGTGFCLYNVTAEVSGKGQARARKEQRRNVHASLRGQFQGTFDIDTEGLREIYYNPFHEESFILKDTREPFKGAAQVYVKDGKAWLVRPHKDVEHEG